MNHKKTILLTGATGFLGSYLLKELLISGHKIFTITRKTNKLSAKQRIRNALDFWTDKSINYDNTNIEVVDGDITAPNLKINSAKLAHKILKEIDIVYHCAGLPKLNLPIHILQLIHREGTRNVLDFALLAKNIGKLEKVIHISTIYVAGNSNDRYFSEEMLDIGQSFNNTYEQSKYEAEKIAIQYIKKGLRVLILRPSMIIGDSIEGKTTNFRLFYEPLHFFSKQIYKQFPADIESTLNLINIDTLANAIFHLEGLNGGTYHVISPNFVKIGDLLKLASDYFGFQLPEFVPSQAIPQKWTATQRMLAKPFIPYFFYSKKFQSALTEHTLNKNNFQMPTINNDKIKMAFQYCERQGFIKKQVRS